jgi:hypothetical protein
MSTFSLKDLTNSALERLAEQLLSKMFNFSINAPTSSKIDEIKNWDNIETFDHEYDWLEQVCAWSVSSCHFKP